MWTYSAVLMNGGVFMTVFVGIDIAKYRHECLVVDHQTKVIHKSFTFDNNRQGFKTLETVLDSLDASKIIKIGFEATSHYGDNLKSFLISLGYDFMEIHPLLVSRFSKANSLRKTKTDKTDAQVICNYLMTVDFIPYHNKSYHIKSLKSLTRSRDALVKDRSRQLVYLTNLLDKSFPEFKPFFDNSLKSSTALYLLNNYTTASKMSRMNLTSYQKMASQLRRTISYGKFNKLRELAKNTVGREDELFEFLIKTHLELYHRFNHSISETDKLILQRYSTLDSFIDTIPGISIISAAGILSETGDIERFSHPDKLVTFCGLEPAIYQSGESEFHGRMVKRGSPYLRQYLMNCAMTVIAHNPVMYDYYSKKRNELKPHRVALSHVAKKLIRIIYKLETTKTNFDSNLMR